MKTYLILFLGRFLIIAMVTIGLRSRAAEILHLDIARINSDVALTWTNPGVALESSLVITGNWVESFGAVSPQVISPTNLARFFRLRAANPPVSFDSLYLAPTFSVLIGTPGAGCGCVSPESPNSPGGLASSGQDNGMGGVFLNTGELKQHAVDLAIPGRGLDWSFERSYRSGMIYDGPLGKGGGWDFNYNRRLVIEIDGSALRMDGPQSKWTCYSEYSGGYGMKCVHSGLRPSGNGTDDSGDPSPSAGPINTTRSNIKTNALVIFRPGSPGPTRPGPINPDDPRPPKGQFGSVGSTIDSQMQSENQKAEAQRHK